MFAGAQQLLSGAGLVALSKINFGLITLCKTSDEENCKAILKKIKEDFPNRLDYFCIESGWSRTIDDIKSFIKNSLNE